MCVLEPFCMNDRQIKLRSDGLEEMNATQSQKCFPFFLLYDIILRKNRLPKGGCVGTPVIEQNKNFVQSSEGEIVLSRIAGPFEP